MKRLVWPSLLTATAVLTACNPYNYGKGDFYAGTVDAVNYPDDYQGGTTKTAAGTVLPVVVATVSGKVVVTYNLAMPQFQVDQSNILDARGNVIGTVPELSLALKDVNEEYDEDGDGAADVIVQTAVTAPNTVYTFDADSDPLPLTPKCVAPKNYVFDARLEAYRKDYQGPVFNALPSNDENASPFLPYYAEVQVKTANEKCQAVKDEYDLLRSKDVTVPITPAAGPGDSPTPTPSGKLVAMWPINPRVDVEPADSQTGWGAQKWGWYNHYLFSFIEGGYLPTQMYSIDIGEATPLEFEGIRAQKWFYPAKRPGAVQDPDTGEFSFPKDPDTMEYVFRDGVPGLSNASAAYAGQVTDLVEGGRGEQGYSPICELCPFDATTADWDEYFNGNPIPLFTNAANVTSCSGTYVYCPQQTAAN